MSQLTDRLIGIRDTLIRESDEVQRKIAAQTEEIRLLKEQAGNDPEALALVAEIELLAQAVNRDSPETMASIKPKIDALKARFARK